MRKLILTATVVAMTTFGPGLWAQANEPATDAERPQTRKRERIHAPMEAGKQGQKGSQAQAQKGPKAQKPGQGQQSRVKGKVGKPGTGICDGIGSCHAG